ncbi:nuclear transport factor 2 family protein [Kitasatospora sp. LaBMicrA B282]|uniref:nuclear transport factor 2 family protein n=1 Tax=Kitasatospora sp. LaBMicrA B282 TaxID=3420949 RepID=UPI003D09D328
MTTTAKPGTAETVQEFFGRFGAGDRPGMLALFAPTVDFLVAGAETVPWTGHRTTPAEVDAFLRSALEDVTTKEFAVERILVDGADAVVLGSFAHEVHRTGKLFSSVFALRITVNDGLIERYHMFENSHGAALAFAQ